VDRTSFQKRYMMASDFDQTLSFNDSGHELAQLLGVNDFEHKVRGLARCNLIQQGGELAYLIRHDPDFRGVRREHLVEAGRRVRLKSSIAALLRLLEQGIEGVGFSFFVISAAPREIVVSALEGIVAAANIVGTEFDYDGRTGEVCAIKRVTAGYGKVTAVDDLASSLGIGSDRIIYVGDGSSDVHVMLHVNHGDGFTISVSENPQLVRIARCTVLSESAISIVVPVLDQVLGMPSGRIRNVLESNGLRLRDWERARTDRVTIDV